MVVAIREQYDSYLSERELSQNHEDKIAELLEEESSIGNAVAMFEMLFYFKDALYSEIIQEIMNKSINAFLNSKSR